MGEQILHIDKLLSETPIGMTEAAKLLGTFKGGRPTHYTTPARWCLEGVKLKDGTVIKLEHFRSVGRLMTSRPAILRFLAAQQEPTGKPPKKTAR